MSELFVIVSNSKSLSICSKVGQLTVDENIMHAQLGLKEIFCVSIVTAGVWYFDIEVTALHHMEEHIIETRPIFVLDLSLNLGVLPANVGVVVHEWREC